jgi:cell division septal protein FtsQ
MDHEQKRHEHHEEVRRQKQAHEREAEREFGKVDRKVNPLWFWALGIAIVAVVLLFWMMS